jgi:hypothetical protein
MAKRVDPLKAKAAKQKKIAIGGAVLLVALLAIQGPKTMKMLQGPQPPTPPASTTAAPAAAVPDPSTPAVAAAGAPTPDSTGQELASIADSDAAPEPESGQLATFERFETKDPFVQQAEAGPAPVADGDDVVSDADRAEQAAEPTPDADGDVGAGTDAGGFTTGTPTPTQPAQPAAPAQPTVADSTSIAVNGVAEGVAVGGTFPKAQPTFVLVSLGKNGSSVQIGIAGGEYAGGRATMTLAFGKKVTLQNTADGSRYELELKSVEGFPLPAKPKP